MSFTSLVKYSIFLFIISTIFTAYLFSFASNFNANTDLLTCSGNSSFYNSYMALTFSIWPYIRPHCAVVHWATCSPVWNLCANMYNCNIA